MPNIKFSYFYRDAGNYKQFGYIIFSDPDDVDIVQLEILIRNKLIDETWFYADQWHLPDLHFDGWNNQLDNTFHEFDCINYTDEATNT